MPPVLEQMTVHPPEANPFLAARFLLTPGRSHGWSKEQFEPFHQLREIDPPAREAMARLLQAAMNRRDGGPAYLYVGNELEGNALHTISDVLGGMFAEEIG